MEITEEQRKTFNAVLEEMERRVIEIFQKENPNDKATGDGWRHALFVAAGENGSEGNAYYDVSLNENGGINIEDSDWY